jgi:catabolite regulation protein CreA
MKTKILMTTLLCCAMIVAASQAEEIGSVDTEFKWLGPDHKIVVEAFDDPKIEALLLGEWVNEARETAFLADRSVNSVCDVV